MTEVVESLKQETVPETEADEQEKMLTQSAVNQLVGQAKADARAKGHAEGFQQGAQSVSVEPTQETVQEQGQQPQAPVMSQDDINRVVEQRLSEIGKNHVHQEIASQLAVEHAKDPATAEELSNWQMPASDQIMSHAANVPQKRGVQVISQLKNDPGKLTLFMGKLAMGDTQGAQQYMNEIASSLDQAEQFSKQNADLPSAPQDQIKGSPNTSGARHNRGSKIRF